MIIGIVAIAMVFGMVASVVTLISGGSMLMALAIYCGVGCLAAFATLSFAMIAIAARSSNSDWTECDTERQPASA